VSIVGIPISITSYDDVLRIIARRPKDEATVIAVCNVHSVMTARRNSELDRALKAAQVATPDGMPLVWALQVLADGRQQRVYGPDLMRTALRHGVDRGWKHYLYGGTPDKLDRLVERIKSFAPGAMVAGSSAPPFRPLHAAEEDAVIGDILASGADIVWVGIGMPKQELWMHRVRERLPGVTLIGVGAAFDLLSGAIPSAPPWIKRMGLEWLFRLRQEPRRLWRRYVINNPLYVVLLMRQLFGHAMRRAGGSRRHER
jgi:N-acetylglucosaminyldiphosphoundecaprenol N-acetyl-beta-D-mannosaminyltransferase